MCEYIRVNINELLKKLEIPKNYPKSYVPKLDKSIEYFGILMPIVVVEKRIRKTVKWELRDGYNRLESAKKLGLKDIPVLVCSESEVGKSEISTIVLNLVRGKECGNRILAFIYNLHTEKKVSIADISKALLKSPETIEKYLRAYRRFSEMVIAVTDTDKRNELLKRIDDICPSIKKFIACIYASRDLYTFVQCLEEGIDKVTATLDSEKLKMVEKLLKIIEKYKLTPEDIEQIVHLVKASRE